MSHTGSLTRIQRLLAREVFDSRGRPTIEVEIHCGGGRGLAIAPSGASKGQFEAVELRDSTDRRLDGTGVRGAVAQIHERVAPALAGVDAADQAELDRLLVELDGTSNKSKLGGNVTTAVSLAAAHAAAAARGVLLVEHLQDLWRLSARPATWKATPATARLGTSMLLPLPMVNMISGGLHAGKNLDLQDFLIIPVGATSFRQALDWIVETYHALGCVLRNGGFEGTLVGDEGGYGPKLPDNAQAAELIVAAISAAGFEPGRQIAIALDVAATHLVAEGGYRLPHTPPDRLRTAGELVDLFADWVAKFPILSIEDPLSEEDDAGWRAITERLGDRMQLIGDDLFVTNAQLLKQGIDGGLANSVLIKVNQIGTLTETFETLQLALSSGYRPVISARSGETEDSTIADLAVATGAGQIKIGSVARSERLAKYNQLLRLEERLGDRAGYLGGTIFRL